MLTVRDAPRASDRVGVVLGARRLLAAVLLEGRAGERRLPAALLGRRRADQDETQDVNLGTEPWPEDQL